jgi:hypothetical protein
MVTLFNHVTDADLPQTLFDAVSRTYEESLDKSELRFAEDAVRGRCPTKWSWMMLYLSTIKGDVGAAAAACVVVYSKDAATEAWSEEHLDGVEKARRG